MEVVTEEYTGHDPLGDVVSWNLRRRHLTDSQRASIAAKLANMPVGRNWGKSNSDHDLNYSVSQAQAGRIMDVSSRAVWMAKKIHEEAIPEIAEKLDAGDMSLRTAEIAAKLPENLTPQSNDIIGFKVISGNKSGSQNERLFMLDALISGRLIKDPELKTGKSGKAYAHFMMSVSVCDSENIVVSGIAFEALAERLAQLKKGDALSVAGALKPTEWTDKTGETKHGLSVIVNQMLSVYDIQKRRPKVKEAPAHHDQPFNDDIPWQ